MSRKEVNFKSKLIEWSQKNKMEVSFELIEQFLDEDTIRCSTPKSASKGYRQVPAPVFQEGVATKCGTDGIEKN